MGLQSQPMEQMMYLLQSVQPSSRNPESDFSDTILAWMAAISRTPRQASPLLHSPRFSMGGLPALSEVPLLGIDSERSTLSAGAPRRHSTDLDDLRPR